MASKAKVESTIRLLSQLFRFEGEDLSAEWTQLLLGMTDADIVIATAYMRENYQSSFTPPLATFKAWGTVESKRNKINSHWWRTHTIETIVNETGRCFALCEETKDQRGDTILRPLLVPLNHPAQPKRVSKREHVQRLIDLAAVMDGKLSGVNWSRFKNLSPTDIALRRELRNLMGWPEQREQGEAG